jgi:L,D-transpeptidase ErfK/SrfK
MKGLIGLLASFVFCCTLNAAIYPLPAKGQNVVGQIHYFTAEKGDTLSNIGMAFDVGRDAMVTANPPFKAEEPLPEGVPVVVPAKFILPPFPHKGVVVDLSTMRLYYYPPGESVVMTYPLGVGKPGHMTPLGLTYVTRKQKDPAWIPPQSIRDYNKKRGVILPRVIRGGPDNPLGRRAIYLGIPQYLIHATNFPQSIGSRGSFGCMRMMENNIEQLFPYIAKRTSVQIIEQPYLAGWFDGQLYLEIHQPLAENRYSPNKLIAPVLQKLTALALLHHVTVNWTKVNLAFATASGIPTVVSDSASSGSSWQFAAPELQWPKKTTLCRLSRRCSE